ncbi:MAG: hypothetical protein QW533_00350 [Thermoplasmata archaeon]
MVFDRDFLGNLGKTPAEGDTSTSSMFEYINCIPVKGSIAIEERSPKVTGEAEAPSVRAG